MSELPNLIRRMNIEITEVYRNALHFRVQGLGEFKEARGCYEVKKRRAYVRLISSKIFSRVPQETMNALFSIISHIDSMVGGSPFSALDINSLNVSLRRLSISEKNACSVLPSGVSLNIKMFALLETTTYSKSGSSLSSSSSSTANSPTLSMSIGGKIEENDKTISTGRGKK